MTRIAAMIMVIIGGVLLVLGIMATDSLADRFSHFFTGQFTDSTVWSIVFGLILVVAGVTIMIRACGRKP